MISRDPIATLFRLGLGPWLTPLRGKVPVLDAWPELPPVDEETVRTWISLRYNLGLRTGSKSGIVVIDDDQAKNGASGFVPPPTGLVVATPTGGRHYYYRCPAVPPGNTASKVAPYVDVRGEGGQVVVPPSVHPNTGTAYVWLEPGEPGELPESAVPSADATGANGHHPAPPDLDMRSPVLGNPPVDSRYAHAALLREAHAVRTATEGTRNDTLNRAAFSLGQLAAGGVLDPEVIAAELAGAATLAGLPQDEAAKTIASGLRGGSAHPRGVPERPDRAATATVAAPDPGPRPTLLVPGSHIRRGGEYLEVGNDRFSHAVLDALIKGELYRRGGTVGEVQGGQFVPITSDRLRSIIDRAVRLIASKPPTTEGGEPTEVYRTCSRDLAAIVAGYASVEGRVRELRHVSPYPICAGPEFTIAEPGWNDQTGVFLACNDRVDPLPLAEARAVLSDLVCDFPWASDADRANYFGLLVTVVVRPCIGEPVPMHLIGAPVAGSGKSKLAEIVLGCGVLGRPLPASQIGVREEEREKRIMGAMLSGNSVINLDNLRDFVDSASLASLLTCSTFNGRELGHSRMVSLPNDSTVVASGNNVHATDEIARRIVPIMLQPAIESPENRQDYRHPFLRKYVEDERLRILGALFGLVHAWCSVGRPLGGRSIGSFERWSSVVGGIMRHAGYAEWGTNLQTWRGVADDTNTELRQFVKHWLETHATEWVETGALFALAEAHELFERRLASANERGRKTLFGQRVLSAAANRVVNGHRIELEGEGKRRRARLVPV